MKGIVIVMIGLFFCGSSVAVEEEPLVGDRPDFTESGLVVTRPQLESGYTMSASGEGHSHTIGEFLYRFPLFARLEGRLELPSGTRTPDLPWGLSDAGVGVKVKVVDSDGKMIPHTSVIMGLSVPVGSPEYTETVMHPKAKVCMAWPLEGDMDLSVNLNVADIGQNETRTTQFSGSVSWAIPLYQEWGGYGEYYALFPPEKGEDPVHVLSLGITYGLTSDLQVDFRVGKEMTSPNSYVGTGFIARF